MDIGTVNFDDLFDFSPEPHDREESNRGGIGERERENYRLNGDWHDTSQGRGQTQSTSTQNNGQDNEAMVRQLWEELPDVEVEELSRSLDSRRPRKGLNRGGDSRVKLERSRQSARECRARKKLRYQYLDDMIAEREKANDALREELMRYVSWCRELDMGRIPEGFDKFMKNGAEVK